MAIVT